MQNLISNLLNEKTKIASEVIAMSMLVAAKEEAKMYLDATLTSTNPELRLIYSNGLNQMVTGHSAVTELSICKNWIKPNTPLFEQLLDIYNNSEQ